MILLKLNLLVYNNIIIINVNIYKIQTNHQQYQNLI